MQSLVWAILHLSEQPIVETKSARKQPGAQALCAKIRPVMSCVFTRRVGLATIQAIGLSLFDLSFSDEESAR